MAMPRVWLTSININPKYHSYLVFQPNFHNIFLLQWKIKNSLSCSTSVVIGWLTEYKRDKCWINEWIFNYENQPRKIWLIYKVAMAFWINIYECQPYPRHGHISVTQLKIKNKRLTNCCLMMSSGMRIFNWWT